MKKILLSTLLASLFLLVNSGMLFAFEDPRWEGKSLFKAERGGKKQTEKKQLPPQPPLPADIRSQYELEKDKKTLELLKESPTPIRTPDTILRVLFMPYIDESGILRTHYYAFLKIEDGKWIIGDYLMPSPVSFRKKSVLTPLDFATSAESEKKEEKKEPAKDNKGGEVVDPIR